MTVPRWQAGGLSPEIQPSGGLTSQAPQLAWFIISTGANGLKEGRLHRFGYPQVRESGEGEKNVLRVVKKEKKKKKEVKSETPRQAQGPQADTVSKNSQGEQSPAQPTPFPFWYQSWESEGQGQKRGILHP